MPNRKNKPAPLDKPTPRAPLPCARREIPGSLSGEPNRFHFNIYKKWGWGGLAAAALLATTCAPAQIAPLSPAPPPKPPKRPQRPPAENIEWIWQYTPDDVNKQGRENDLVQDLRFRPFLDQYLTAPQSFWGTPIDGQPRSLAVTALDHLTVPDRVVADDNRYVSVEGCVVHFCPARGLLWVDLNGTHHLVVFAAIDWNKQGRPTTDPAAEYTLWVFPDEPFTIAAGPGPHPPADLIKSIARWAAEPLPGSGIVQLITRAILVDPDGTPHDVAPADLGIAPPPSATGTDTNTSPALSPRK